MTGLDPEKDTIMEIACFVTDHDLCLYDQVGFRTVVRHTQEQMDGMNQWCIDTHGASGLTQQCLGSSTTPDEAAQALLKYIGRFVSDRKRPLLAGSSVHADKAFLAKPPYRVVLDRLDHRILDVSSIKEAARRWAPRAVIEQTPRKQKLHEAREDILESINEARFYRDHIFRGAA